MAVVPAGATSFARVSLFCAQLAAAIGPSARHVRAEDANPVARPLASTHDLVVCEADGRQPAWSRECVRQADRVVLVAEAGASPSPGPAEQAVAAVSAGRPRHDLVVVHPLATTAPSGTAKWLQGRFVEAHHHVREGDLGDLRRLARVLQGRGVALVLGGGGARGLAHLGVMRALEEAGVPVDAVGGTSIGAIMAAALAMGWDHETRVANAVATFVKTRFLLGFTFPAVALSSAKKLTRIMRHPDYFGERAIEDLWRPYFCVSTSLARAEVVVHDRGPTWLAARASIALPAVLPPVWADGDLLVDGGVLNDLPVDVMRSRFDGRIVAVDLEPAPTDRAPCAAFAPALSGWRVLGRKLNPFSTSAAPPGALEILARAREVGIRCQRRRHAGADVDLWLHPPTDDYRMFDFGAGKELIELGYRYACEQLSGGVPWNSLS